MPALPFKILGVNHIGIAPKNPDQLAEFLHQTLQLNHAGEETVTDQKTHTRMYDAGHKNYPFLPRIEVLSPAPDHSADSPIQKYLDKFGGGIHHLALQVDNVEKAIAYLLSQKVKMIDEKPRLGAHQTRVAFIHPHATGGILIELVQEASP